MFVLILESIEDIRHKNKRFELFRVKLCINLPEGKNNHYEIAGTELELLSIKLQ